MAFKPTPIFDALDPNKTLKRVFWALETDPGQSVYYRSVRENAPASFKVLDPADDHISVAFSADKSLNQLRNTFNPVAELCAKTEAIPIHFTGLNLFVNNHQHKSRQDKPYAPELTDKSIGLKSHTVVFAQPDGAASTEIALLHKNLAYKVLHPLGHPSGRRDLTPHTSLLHVKNLPEDEKALKDLMRKYGRISTHEVLQTHLSLLCDWDLNQEALKKSLNWNAMTPDEQQEIRKGKYMRLACFSFKERTPQMPEI